LFGCRRVRPWRISGGLGRSFRHCRDSSETPWIMQVRRSTPNGLWTAPGSTPRCVSRSTALRAEATSPVGSPLVVRQDSVGSRSSLADIAWRLAVTRANVPLRRQRLLSAIVSSLLRAG
jgi:hypothetical protein